MSEEDFACDKFVSQKFRADVCRNCFQSARLHNKRQHKSGPAGTTDEEPVVKSAPKVLESLRKKRQLNSQESPPETPPPISPGLTLPKGPAELHPQSNGEVPNGRVEEDSVLRTKKVDGPSTSKPAPPKSSLIPSKPPPPPTAVSRPIAKPPPPSSTTTAPGPLTRPPPGKSPAQGLARPPPPGKPPSPGQTRPSPSAKPPSPGKPPSLGGPRSGKAPSPGSGKPPSPGSTRRSPSARLPSPGSPRPSLPAKPTSPVLKRPPASAAGKTTPTSGTRPLPPPARGPTPPATPPAKLQALSNATEAEGKPPTKRESPAMPDSAVALRAEHSDIPSPSVMEEEIEILPPPQPEAEEPQAPMEPQAPPPQPQVTPLEPQAPPPQALPPQPQVQPQASPPQPEPLLEPQALPPPQPEVEPAGVLPKVEVPPPPEPMLAPEPVATFAPELSLPPDQPLLAEGDVPGLQTDGGVPPPPSFVEEDFAPPPPPPMAFAAENVSPPPQFQEELLPPPSFAGDDEPPPLLFADNPPAPPPAPPVPEIVPPPPGYVPPEARGVPFPPPPPPPINAPQQVGRVPPPPPPRASSQEASMRVPSPDSAMAQAMATIRGGGVALRSVPAPQPRAVGDEAVVDVASELRQKMMKRRKKENQGLTEVLEEKREEVSKMKELLVNCSRTHSFTHQLKALLMRVDKFLAEVQVPAEVLSRKLQWPIKLEQSLREVVAHMARLDERVKAAELLCQQTLESCRIPQASQEGMADRAAAVSDDPSMNRVNPDAVEKCVNDVVRLARAMNTDESAYFLAAQSFPVDESDRDSFLQRAGAAIAPLMDLLYQKAFHTYDSIFEPSISHFDKRFRVQNAQRLLKMCCLLSDALGIHVNVPRHYNYSQAQLKERELRDNFTASIQIHGREGQWDTEESMQLRGRSPLSKPVGASAESSALLQRIVACLSAPDNAQLLQQLEQDLNPQNYAKIEGQLRKEVLAHAAVNLVDGAIALARRVYSEDKSGSHRFDYEWLVDVVAKGQQLRVRHMVTSCGLDVNALNKEGSSVLHRAVNRKDLATAACLIRLGADPTLRNNRGHSPVQLLALKCFPQAQYPTNTQEKEPMFNVSSYMNNPSLSDVVLVSDDGHRFFAHRLILCVQSPVFKTMLDSDLWADAQNKEIPLPTVSGRVLQYLLQYLYTGACHFPQDDLNLGVELVGVADQFLLDPMKLQCERVLSSKIDSEVVVPLYYAAVRFSTPRLLANSSHFLLEHYQEVEDPDHEVLLHLLENTSSMASPAPPVVL